MQMNSNTIAAAAIGAVVGCVAAVALGGKKISSKKITRNLQKMADCVPALPARKRGR